MASIQLDALSGVIDVEDLMTRCLGNLDFAERILTVFQTRSGSDLEELEKAVQEADLLRAERLAHRLKGACANAGAHQLSKLASNVWSAASRRCREDVEPSFAELRGEWERCLAQFPHNQVVAQSAP